MKPARFDYHRATSIDDAVAALAGAPDDARVLAGGQSLLALMTMRLSRPTLLIDLNEVPELTQISASEHSIEIGAMTRQRAVERDPLVAAEVPLLARAVALIAHPAIRNRGTIGGSLAHADPASELGATIVALDARLVLRSPAGERVVPAAEFITGPFDTCLADDEIITAVRFDRFGQNRTAAIVEHSRRAGDFAVAGVVCVLDTAADGLVSAASVVGFGVGPRPHRSPGAADALIGRLLGDPSAADQAARALADEINPSSDLHGSGAYRRRIAAEMVRRAIGECAAPNTAHPQPT